MLIVLGSGQMDPICLSFASSPATGSHHELTEAKVNVA